MSDINTNVRLFDLVRYCRAELHEEGLIDDKEYAWICAEASMNKSPSGGSASARRLEDYDELKDRIKRLEKAGDKMHDWLMSKNRIGCDMEIASEWTRAKKNKP